MDEKLSGPREGRGCRPSQSMSRGIYLGAWGKYRFIIQFVVKRTLSIAWEIKPVGWKLGTSDLKIAFEAWRKQFSHKRLKFSAFLNCTLQSHGSLFYVTEFGESLQVSGCFWKLCQTLCRAENLSVALTLVLNRSLRVTLWRNRLFICLFNNLDTFAKLFSIHWTAFSRLIRRIPIVLSIQRVVDETSECKFIFRAACFQENRWKSLKWFDFPHFHKQVARLPVCYV